MKVIDECLSKHQKRFEFIMKVFDEYLLITPKTILIYYEGTW